MSFKWDLLIEWMEMYQLMWEQTCDQMILQKIICWCVWVHALFGFCSTSESKLWLRRIKRRTAGPSESLWRPCFHGVGALTGSERETLSTFTTSPEGYHRPVRCIWTPPTFTLLLHFQRYSLWIKGKGDIIYNAVCSISNSFLLKELRLSVQDPLIWVMWHCPETCR